jgi:hypothetical protein
MVVDPSHLRRGRLVYGWGDSFTEGETHLYGGGDSFTEGEIRLRRGRLVYGEGDSGDSCTEHFF